MLASGVWSSCLRKGKKDGIVTWALSVWLTCGCHVWGTAVLRWPGKGVWAEGGYLARCAASRLLIKCCLQGIFCSMPGGNSPEIAATVPSPPRVSGRLKSLSNWVRIVCVLRFLPCLGVGCRITGLDPRVSVAYFAFPLLRLSSQTLALLSHAGLARGRRNPRILRALRRWASSKAGMPAIHLSGHPARHTPPCRTLLSSQKLAPP